MYKRQALAEPWAVEHALRTLRRLRAEQADPAALRHAPGGVGGLLDDQVQVALAALEAFEVTGEAEWIDWSGAIMERVWRDYRDPLGGGLYDTAERDGPGLLPTRATPVQDAPTPSPNGVAALCLARLHAHTQAPEWAERRDALLGAFAGAAPALGIYGATLLLALDWAVQPAAHLVIVAGEGPEAEPLADAMHRAALATWVPRRVVRRVRPGDLDPAATPPALRAMLAAGGGTRGYACVGATCQRPATDLAGWRAALAAIGGPAGGD